MIEKFTKEELNTIREELNNLPKGAQKRTVAKESFSKLHELFRKRVEYNGIYNHELGDHILAVADYTFANYEKSNMWNGRYRRRTIVPSALTDEYGEFIGELCKLVEKHFKEDICD